MILNPLFIGEAAGFYTLGQDWAKNKRGFG